MKNGIVVGTNDPEVVWNAFRLGIWVNGAIIKNPINCIVFYAGCEAQCPEGAIKFPSTEATQKIIEKLQRTNA